MASQGQSLFTRNYRARIIKNRAKPKYRMCDQYNYKIDPFVSGCQVICPSEDKSRHERVGQYMHWKICQHYNATHKKTDTNTNHNLLSKQIMPLSYGTLQYTLIEKLMLINQILALKITKTTQVY